jgi:hypothetical protein
VEVDHRDLLEHRRRDDAPEGHHDPEVDPRVEHVGHPVGDRQAQLDGGRLHRRGLQRAAAAAALVRLGDHDGDLVAGGDEGLQRGDGQRRRPEVGQPPRRPLGQGGDGHRGRPISAG